MSETTAVRTLLKSVPELWAACSDAEALAGHLGAFGEIKISRLEPETTVAWEGDRASGTVTLEQAAWGTKVTMTAITAQERPSDQLERTAEETPPVEETADVEEAPPAEETADVTEATPVEEDPPVEETPDVTEATPVEEDPAVEETPPAPTGPFARLLARWRSRDVAPVSGLDGDENQAPDETPAAPISLELPTPEPPTLEASASELPTPEPPTLEASASEPPTPEPPTAERAQLEAALDSLGQAHHRPFSNRDPSRS